MIYWYILWRTLDDKYDCGPYRLVAETNLMDACASFSSPDFRLALYVALQLFKLSIYIVSSYSCNNYSR